VQIYNYFKLNNYKMETLSVSVSWLHIPVCGMQILITTISLSESSFQIVKWISPKFLKALLLNFSYVHISWWLLGDSNDSVTSVEMRIKFKM
jgi:hypothetical protein